MITCLETARTLMRPFESLDAAEAFTWFGNPAVMQFIPSGPDQTIEDTRTRIARYREHQHKHGFGKWVIMDRSLGIPIGDAGLSFLPDGRRVELGYRLAESFWGKGLATEVAQAWIQAAPDLIEGPLYAFAHPDNGGSLQVIRKLGFTFLQNETLYGWDVPLHVLPLQR